jgi:hypothetical protein
MDRRWGARSQQMCRRVRQMRQAAVAAARRDKLQFHPPAAIAGLPRVGAILHQPLASARWD